MISITRFHLLTHHVDLLPNAFVAVKYCEVGHCFTSIERLFASLFLSPAISAAK
jgi:hypothetical protein